VTRLLNGYIAKLSRLSWESIPVCLELFYWQAERAMESTYHVTLRRQYPRASGKMTFFTEPSERGGVAQLAEQRTHKPRVTRSIRVTATR
jgi:hypothetical protein